MPKLANLPMQLEGMPFAAFDDFKSYINFATMEIA